MRAHTGLLAALALLIVPTGCAEEGPTCATGEVLDTVTGECIVPDFDAGPMDAGDGDAGADAGPDGGMVDPCMGECAGDEICRDDGMCVDCTEDEPCDTGHCDTTGGTCVECVEDEHCSNPAAPTCTPAHVCEAGCTTGSDCSPRFEASHPYCDLDSGACVECTVTNLCGGTQTCDLTSGDCVDVAPGTVTEECRPCTNDLQCAGDMRCIPLNFETAPRAAYCLRPFTVCTQPFAHRLMGRTSINGAAAADYCGVNESLTTCEAAWALAENWTCDADDWDGRCRDLESAEIAVDGALCESFPGLGFRCTIRCTNNTQCQPTGDPAPDCTGTTASPGYCAPSP